MKEGSPAAPAPTHAPRLLDERRRQRDELRDRVLNVAAAIVEREGMQGLSMRKLAVAVGCAPMSLYSYFADKHAVQLALASQSFAGLAGCLTDTRGGTPLDALRALYMAYARFGLERPDEYRTLFMVAEARVPRTSKDPGEMRSENPAFAVGFERVLACVAVGQLVGDPHALTTLLWTAVHGAVAAILTLPEFPFGDPMTYIGRAFDLTLSALRMQPCDPLV